MLVGDRAGPLYWVIRRGFSETAPLRRRTERRASSQPERRPKQGLWDSAQHTPTALQFCSAPLSGVLPSVTSNNTQFPKYAMLPLASMSPHALFPLSHTVSACPSAKLTQDSGQRSIKAELLYSQDLGLCLLTHCWDSKEWVLTSSDFPLCTTCTDVISCIFIHHIHPFDSEPCHLTESLKALMNAASSTVPDS